MALNAILTAEEFKAIPDVIKTHYREEGENHILDVTSNGELELVNSKSLKSALQKEREARTKFEKDLKQFKDIDPEKAREALSKMDEMASWDPDKKLAEARKQLEKQLTEQFSSREKQLVEKSKSEFEGVSKKYDATRTQLQRTLVDSVLAQAIATEKGVPELLIPALRSTIKMVELDDGTWEARVVDKDGTERLSTKSGAGASDRMTIPELVAEVKRSTVFARAFDGSSTGGSGASGSDSGRNNGSFSLSEADARDPVKYRHAREAAQKAGKTLEIA